jgi:uncharacterized protein YkwD
VVTLTLAGPSAAQPDARETAPTAEDQIEMPVVQLINEIRAEHGLRPLKVSAKLAQAAETHAVSMGTEGYFDHTSSDGTSFWKRIARFFPQEGFRRWTVGENLLWASPRVTPNEALQMWLGSPGHRRVLLSPAWTHIGLAAVHITDAPGIFDGFDVTIVAADFGARS